MVRVCFVLGLINLTFVLNALKQHRFRSSYELHRAGHARRLIAPPRTRAVGWLVALLDSLLMLDVADQDIL